MDRMIGRSWAEWEESIEDSDLDNQAEIDYADYRATVGRETPDLILENDIKSECGGGYETELVHCDRCKLAFKICHLRAHVLNRHPDFPEVKYTPPESSVSKPESKKVKKEVVIRENNNTVVKKRSASPQTSASTSERQPVEKRLKKEKDERASIFFSRRENPVVIFGQCEESIEPEVEPPRSYLNFIKPLAYPRYGCYVDKNAKIHTYSSASRNLNQKLQLLQSPIIQGMEQAEFEGSSPMTPLSQPSPNLPPKLNKLAHVRVQH